MVSSAAQAIRAAPPQQTPSPLTSTGCDAILLVDISNRYIDTTMLELAILGLLKEQELHGYELKKRLVDALGPFSSVSFGSLYPALARLRRAGAVEASAAPALPPPAPTDQPIPMTGSIAGEAAAFRARRAARAPRTERRSSRVRKVYRITLAGEALFASLLSAEPAGDDDRVFNLKLVFCRYLAPEARL